MKQGLSKREKILVFIAAVIVVAFAAFKFVIGPMYNDYNEKSDKIDSLTYERDMTRIKLASEAVTVAGFEKAEDNFGDIKERYPGAVPNEEIARILTAVCKENNLNTLSMNISDARAYNQPSKKAEESGEGEKANYFLITTVNMSLNGDYASLKGLVDTVNSIEYLRIYKVSYSGNYSERLNNPNITVTFELTVLDAGE